MVKVLLASAGDVLSPLEDVDEDVVVVGANCNNCRRLVFAVSVEEETPGITTSTGPQLDDTFDASYVHSSELHFVAYGIELRFVSV